MSDPINSAAVLDLPQNWFTHHDQSGAAALQSMAALACGFESRV